MARCSPVQLNTTIDQLNGQITQWVKEYNSTGNGSLLVTLPTNTPLGSMEDQRKAWLYLISSQLETLYNLNLVWVSCSQTTCNFTCQNWQGAHGFLPNVSVFMFGSPICKRMARLTKPFPKGKDQKSK